MSILIKGMKMPKNCLKCPFCLFSDGNWKCLVDGSHADFGGTCRPSLCPLVRVPAHGDLIDRDVLLDEQVPATLFPCGLDGKLEVQTNAVAVGDVMYAPTIIPADEGER